MPGNLARNASTVSASVTSPLGSWVVATQTAAFRVPICMNDNGAGHFLILESVQFLRARLPQHSRF